jgi:Tfp pilus assembly protein PilF
MSPAAPRRRTPAAFFEAGLRLFKAGQLSEAEKCGRQALALDAAHADSLHLMGLLCLAAKQHHLAIEWFAQAIRQNPDVADYFSNLGTALQQQGRYEEAAKSFDRACSSSLISPRSGISSARSCVSRSATMRRS